MSDSDLHQLKQRLTDCLSKVYTSLPPNELIQLVDKLLHCMPPRPDISPTPHRNLWDQRDVVLITYGHSIAAKDEPPLATLHRFLQQHLHDSVTCVHLLPFYPQTSDDGFSVVDFCRVNPRLGEWEHIESLAKDFKVMFDAVVNHISAASSWFQTYLTSYDESKLYFIEASARDDLSAVIRPRTSPLLRRVDTVRGERHVWCTFSHDQIDLNFANPEVLLEIIKVLQCYLDHGCRWFRLDAVAFLWKESGSPCINLPQTHELIKVMRLLLEHAEPEAVVVTETNVPLHENLAYFGNANEAHIIYNFSLPPLVVQALLAQNGTCLKNWLVSMPAVQSGTAYLNFLASHDGIGLRPAEGLLDDSQLEQMKDHLKAKGAQTTDRLMPDGTVKTYEINTGLFDALASTYDGPDEFQVQRFLLAYAIAFGLAGVPAVYIHSFLASPNDYQRYQSTGVNRALNRYIWQEQDLQALLNDEQSMNSQVLAGLKKLISIRQQQPALHPNASQHILHLRPELLGFFRQDVTQNHTLFAVYNLTSRPQECSVADLNLECTSHCVNVINGTRLLPSEHILLQPYEFIWLTPFQR